MASQTNITILDSDENAGLSSVAEIIGDLNHALDRLDELGLTHAGALLARVLDTLASFVTDAS